MKFKALLLGAALGAALGIPTAANADPFTVTWSGAQFDNNVTAIGHFDFSATPADLAGAQNMNLFPSPNVHLLDLTVSGASAGNGSFTEADFSSYYFASYSQLDLSKELIGQAMGNGCFFGSFSACYGGPSGDFNLFQSVPDAPSGSFYFTLTTAGGEQIGVTSIRPDVSAVPEPATWAMMLLGFGFVGGAIRTAKRRQKLTLSYA